MRSANEKKMFGLLLDEVEDTLEKIEQRCFALESSDQAKELQVIFRAAHNIKGASQLFGMTDFAGFVHKFEDLLTTMQKCGRTLGPDSVDLLLAIHGFLNVWVQTLREKDDFIADMAPLKARIAEHVAMLKSLPPADAPPSGSPEGAKTPSAATPAAAATPAEPLTPEAIAALVVATSNESAQTQAPAVATATPTTAETVASTSTTVANVPTQPPSAPPSAEAAAATASVVTAPAPASGAAAAAPKTSTGESGSGGSGHSKTKRSNATLRVPSAKIDEVMQLIGELSIHQGILWHNLQNNSFNILTCKNPVILNQKTLKSLYDLILTLRMQSAETLFQRLEKTARDVAREQKKKVNVQLIGADTPLDKTLIELISDPMMHLVRNAIDHGIEDNETRLKVGKPENAVLKIETQQDAGHVVISISDDGRGLDPQLILQKAIKKGIIAPEQKLSEEEIIHLIFMPGFSTRDTVTEISGRGVGMDVVQKAIQQVGGTIEIKTKLGKGTSFHITLPANVEIIEGLLIRVEEHLYMVPRAEVVEILDLDSLVVDPVGMSGRAIRLRNEIIPLEHISDYVGIGTSKTERKYDTGAKSVALMVKLPEQGHLALQIDVILSQQQLVVRPLAEYLGKIPGFTGMTILGNGEPAMIVSLTSIAEHYMNWQRKSGEDTAEQQISHGESA